ncbi:MAG: hypothetical protein C0497_09945 [Gemmatimonas sp.]|nr:hypothetical protein [Gemmatimonas sp.]
MATRTDARKSDAATQALQQRSVVKAVRAGMTQTAAAPTFGVSLRAYERHEAAITRWLRQEYPAIARQAKREMMGMLKR